MRRSILTEKVARRGHHLAREYRVDPFTLTRVREVMTTEVETVPASMTLHQAAAFLTSPEDRHPSFPGGRCRSPRARDRRSADRCLRWRRAGKHRTEHAGGIARGRNPDVAYPDEYLDGLIDRMIAGQRRRICR